MTRRGFVDLCAHPEALPLSNNRAGAQLPRGFVVELGEVITEQLCLAQKISWVRRERGLGIDCDVFGAVPVLDHRVLVTPADSVTRRPPPVLKTRPYMAVRMMVVSRAPLAQEDLMTVLQTLRVAAPSGSWAHMRLNKQGARVLVSHLDDESIIRAVLDGTADAGIVSHVGLGWFLKEHPGAEIHAVRSPVELDLDYDLGFGLRDSDYATRQRVNQVIEGVVADGTVSRILGRYGIEYVPASF